MRKKKKIKSQHLELDQIKKNYKKNNLIDWEKSKCVICNFLLEINVIGVDAKPTEISHFEFVLRKEHKFLRNIFSKDEVEKSKNLESLNSYDDAFLKFVNVSILLDNTFMKSCCFCKIVDEHLKDFCKNNCADVFR